MLLKVKVRIRSPLAPKLTLTDGRSIEETQTQTAVEAHIEVQIEREAAEASRKRERRRNQERSGLRLGLVEEQRGNERNSDSATNGTLSTVQPTSLQPMKSLILIRTVHRQINRQKSKDDNPDGLGVMICI